MYLISFFHCKVLLKNSTSGEQSEGEFREAGGKKQKKICGRGIVRDAISHRRTENVPV
jgi:hypothetical protein